MQARRTWCKAHGTHVRQSTLPARRFCSTSSGLERPTTVVQRFWRFVFFLFPLVVGCLLRTVCIVFFLLSSGTWSGVLSHASSPSGSSSGGEKLPNSILAMLCDRSVWLWATSRQRLSPSRSQTQMPWVVPSTRTDRGRAARVRVWSPNCEGHPSPPLERPVVPELSDDDGLWKGEVCHSLCWSKLFRSRPLDGLQVGRCKPLETEWIMSRAR